MEAEEALRRAGASAALSHGRAAAVWGIEMVEPGTSRLTVPRNRSRLVIPGWVVVRADLSAACVEERDGSRLTGVLRTLQDLCRVLTFMHAVVAADSALRQGLVGEIDLRGRLDAARGHGSARPRAVARALDPLSGSVLETLLRLLLLEVLPAPLSQFEVRDRLGVFVARVDLCWPDVRLVVEADGFHSDRAAYRRPGAPEPARAPRLAGAAVHLGGRRPPSGARHGLVQECYRQGAA